MMYVFEMMRQYFRMGASSYVYWNIALGEDSESTWGWKQNSLIHVVDGKGRFTPEFYLMKHFSHFIKRGARYLKLKGEYSSASVAFKNPDGTTVLVVANPYVKEITISFGGLSYTLPPRSINTITE